MMARASLARSRAVVTWRSSGRPLTLAKVVRVILRRRAASFMRNTNASSLPATVSAIITATSLADLTIRTRSAVSSEIDSPSFNQSLLGACSVAFLEQMALVSGLTLPSFNAWKAT